MTFEKLQALGQTYLSLNIGPVHFSPIQTCLIIGALVVAFGAAIGLWRIGMREDRRRRLDAILTAARDEPKPREASGAAWYERLGAAVAPSPIIGIAEQERLLIALERAGIKGHGRLSSFIGAKICCAIVVAALAWLMLEWFQLFGGAILVRLAVLVGALILGWRLPELILARLAARRRAQLELGMPDALDLLVICAEAGLNLSQALEEIGRDLRTSNRAVAEEFATTAAEMRVLSDRSEALENLARRTGLNTLRGMISTLNQSIRFGTPLTESLGILAATMRAERMSRLEERAARLPVLLALPLMGFVMPSLLMIIGTPLGLRIVDQLKAVAGIGGTP
jgi:tight adherence protein C